MRKFAPGEVQRERSDQKEEAGKDSETADREAAGPAAECDALRG